MFLFFHGGPGLNANPERHLLAPAINGLGQNVALFDEPSRKRPEGPLFDADNAFANYMRAADEFFLSHTEEAPAIIIGHSFGSLPAVMLADQYPERTRNVVLISGCLDLTAATRNVLRVAEQDFRAAGDDRAVALRGFILKLEGQFDTHAQQGLQLASEDHQLMAQYWHCSERRDVYLSHYAPTKFDFDPEGFMALRSTLQWRQPKHCNVPVLAVYGSHDPVTKMGNEAEILSQLFTDVTIEEFHSSGHYPHIEEQGRFVDLLSGISS